MTIYVNSTYFSYPVLILKIDDYKYRVVGTSGRLRRTLVKDRIPL